MVPAAVTLKRSKTVSIIVLAVATIIAALWLAPPSTPRRIAAGPGPVAEPGDPCAVRVSSRLTSTHVLVGNRDEHLVVTLRAPSCGQNAVRPPMSIAVVIDKSKSMAPDSVRVEDQPLTHAKQAAIALLDQLEPSDAFSIVAYAWDAQVVTPMTFATPDAKLAARRAIAGIEGEPSTNISAGLELGRTQVNASPIEDGIRRLILISDGAANAGVHTPDGLRAIATDIAAHGASISSVGLGLEYNESTMTDIAAAGRGNYYFVESSTELAQMFTAELGSAGRTVAADAELTLIASPDLEVLDVFGRGVVNDELGTWTIPVADLGAGEVRKIVARVRLRGSATGTIDLATARLVYRPIDAHQRRSVEATARAEVTSDAQLVRAGIDTGTVQLAEEAETARAIDDASLVYEREGAARANELLDQRIQQVQAAASAYGDAGIADRSVSTAKAIKGEFSAAPTGGHAGNKAKKVSSQAAYELAR